MTNTTPDRPVPRRRPPRGDAGDRARDRPVRRRARRRPGRGATPQLHPADAFPFTTASGASTTPATTSARSTSRSGRRATTTCAPSSERRRERATRALLGIGLSVYVEITNGLGEAEFGAVEITPDGGAILRTGLVLARPGPRDDVRDDRRRPARHSRSRRSRVIKGDTDEVARGHRHVRLEVDADRRRRGRAGAARWSSSRRQAARRRPARGQHRRHRARRRRRRFHVAGAPTPALTWARARDAARTRRGGSPSSQRRGRLQRRRADVPVRRARRRRRGRHRDRRGRAPAHRRRRRRGHDHQPAVAEGQVHGGVATGVAQALFEEFAYDEDGNPITANFVGYAFPSAAELPSFERRRDGDADADEPARREGHRRVGDDRRDARRAERGRSTRSPRSACATSTCRPTASASGARSRTRRPTARPRRWCVRVDASVTSTRASRACHRR